MDETKRIIKEYYDVLPDKIKALVVSPTVDTALKNIEKKYNMGTTTVKIFENETYLILLGIEPASSFKTNLVNELGISYDQALKIAIDTNSEIFGSIGELLRAIERDLIKEQEETRGGPESVNESGEFETNKETEPDTATDPNHLIPTHAVMEKIVGMHTHMVSTPSMGGAAPANLPTGTTAPITASPSIVDQKLRGLVRAEREETHIRDDVEKRRKIVYKDADPYREPIA